MQLKVFLLCSWQVIQPQESLWWLVFALLKCPFAELELNECNSCSFFAANSENKDQCFLTDVVLQFLVVSLDCSRSLAKLWKVPFSTPWQDSFFVLFLFRTKAKRIATDTSPRTNLTNRMELNIRGILDSFALDWCCLDFDSVDYLTQ